MSSANKTYSVQLQHDGDVIYTPHHERHTVILGRTHAGTYTAPPLIRNAQASDLAAAEALRRQALPKNARIVESAANFRHSF